MPNHGLVYLFPEEKIHKEKKHVFEIPLFIISVKGLQQMVLFSLRTFGGMLLDIDAFLLSRALVSFSMSAILTVRKEKLPFTTLSLIDLILGWLEKKIIMLSIGSSETADSPSLHSLGIFMFRD